MDVALVDVDSHPKGLASRRHFPNLVLMKLSAWHKARGDTVTLLSAADILQMEKPLERYNKIYGACIFTGQEWLISLLETIGVHVAGSGTNRQEILPYEIEHIRPDYSLYGITDTAYGFLTRGCSRRCPFCIVSRKEGTTSRKVADVAEWWQNESHIKLMDPNILACDEHLDLLRQLADTGAYIDISQGLDARLLTEENIELIDALKIKILHFAWDNPLDKSVPEALENFSRRSKIKDPRKLAVYVLTNYNSTIEQDLERIYWLRDNGFSPYVMVYDKTEASDRTKQLQRWVNSKQIFHKVTKFEDYVARKESA